MAEDQSSFTVIIPSNDPEFKSTNTKSKFRIKFPSNINLNSNDKWTVALTEIFYPSQVYILGGEEILINGIDPIKVAKVCVKSIEHLLLHLNRLMRLKTGSRDYTFSIHPDLKRVCLEIPQGQTLTMTKELCYVLGFGYKNWRFYKARSTAPKAYDIYNYIHSFHIYTNIVQETIIGSQYAKLLRIINRDLSTRNLTAHHQIMRPEYLALNHHQIPYIEIEIYSILGKEIQFGLGDTILSLHFKKKSLFPIE